MLLGARMRRYLPIMAIRVLKIVRIIIGDGIYDVPQQDNEKFNGTLQAPSPTTFAQTEIVRVGGRLRCPVLRVIRESPLRIELCKLKKTNNAAECFKTARRRYAFIVFQ